MTEYDPIQRTRTLARIAGPYFLVMSTVFLFRREDIPYLYTDIMGDAPLVLITGVFTFILGLVMLAFHHHWTGAAGIVLSAMGWISALKGASLVLFPDFGAGITDAFIASTIFLFLACALMFALGAWLSFVGWSRKTP